MENNKETKSDKSAQPQVEDSHPPVSSMHLVKAMLSFYFLEID